MKNKNKQSRAIFVLVFFLISLCALLFILRSFKNEIVFFYSPQEILEKNLDFSKKIRLGGLVVKGSVQRISSLQIEFEVTDGAKQVTVIHKGLTPDLFREGQGVVAYGNFDKANLTFYSREILVKHDENYRPPELEKALRESSKN